MLPQPVFHNQPIHKTAGLKPVYKKQNVYQPKCVYVHAWVSGGEAVKRNHMFTLEKSSVLLINKTKCRNKHSHWGRLASPRARKASGICACLAGTWLFLHTLLHSSCILESGEHRAACFSFGERGSRERGWGWVRFTHRPTLQIGPDWASLDPEKQPKQEERCEFMTKQNTGSQRATLLGGFS